MLELGHAFELRLLLLEVPCNQVIPVNSLTCLAFDFAQV